MEPRLSRPWVRRADRARIRRGQPAQATRSLVRGPGASEEGALRRRRRFATAVVLAAVLAGCSGDGGSVQLCDHLSAVGEIASIGAEMDLDAVRAARSELDGVDEPTAIVADVDALVGLLDFVIERFGPLDLEHPDAAGLAAIQAAQEELETKVLDADPALQRLHEAAQACVTTTT